ncbi:MAG: histidine kinase [Cyclobacteriaceae bacterium]
MDFLKKNKFILLFFGASSIISLALFYFQTDTFLSYTVITISLVILLLWIGNDLITKWLDKSFPWRNYGKWRFFLHLFLGVLYSIGVVNLAYFLVKALFTDILPTVGQLVVANVYGAIVFIPAFSIYFGLYFLKHWLESAVEMERFQKESITSQLTSLKNHLDPHFLFNNLNILSALIDKDQSKSQEFLGRFAQVYRTMLLTKSEDLVTLEEEIEFIETYIYLIKTRFAEHIHFEIDIDDDGVIYMLPPLTLQMLVENAVKHNNIIPDHPLRMMIKREGNRLKVMNTIMEKPEDLRTKSGTGIANIRARYKFYTDEELEIGKQGDLFVVSLPLVETELI